MTRRYGPAAKLYTVNDTTKTLKEWAADIGCSVDAIRNRLKTGMSLEQAVTQKKSSGGRFAYLYTANGVTKTLKEWSADTGLRASTIVMRLRSGMTFEEAVTKPLSREGTSPRQTCNGMSKTLTEWAVYLGIAYPTLSKHLRTRTLAEVVAMTRPGVSLDFEASAGTGAGSIAQEIPEITFSEQAETQ